MKKYQNLLFVFVFVPAFFIGCRTAEKVPTIEAIPHAAPSELGMSEEKLSSLDNLFQAQIDSAHIPCIEAMVIHKGKVAYQYTGGYKNLETKEALEAGGIFRLASMTKPIVGVAIMILYDEGKLSIDDPVTKFIPEFANPTLIETFNKEDTTFTTKPASRALTLKDLLTHTSGIIYPAFMAGTPLSDIYYKHGIIDAWTLEDAVLEPKMAALGPLPLLHNPGEQWTYGISIDVLGRVVEVASGQSLADFLAERIFEPLGMDDTYFYLPPEKHGRLINAYSQNKEGKLVSPDQVDPLAGQLINYPIEGAMTYYSGGGGLSGTTEDYARFGLMLANGGELFGQRVLSQEAVDLMSSNHLEPGTKGMAKFGLSVSVSDARPNALHPEKRGAFGWGGYFKTRCSSDPSEELVIVLMTQSTPNIYTDKMFNTATAMIYGAIEKEEKEEEITQASNE